MSSAMCLARFLAVAVLLSANSGTLAAPPAGADDQTSARQAPLRLIGSAGAGKATSGGPLLDSMEHNRRLISAQVKTEVEQSLRAARLLVRRDPRAARRDLKSMLERVVRVPELSAEQRASLRGKLENALRSASRRAAVHDAAQRQTAAGRARALDRSRIADALARDQAKLEQLMDRFDSLMAEGRYAAADALADRQIAALAPDAPAAVSGRLVAQQRAAHALNTALRSARSKGVVDTLAAVETSNVPSPDDQPIVYPQAEVWEKLSRRRAEYRLTDARDASPAETRIRRELDAKTKMEFVETPLDVAVRYLKDLHGIEIQLDTKALEEAGVFIDSPVTAEMEGVSLRGGLRFLLRPLDLTYIVKDEVLLVTTAEVASREIVARVYPLEDLVTPIPFQANGGGDFGVSTPLGTPQSPFGSSLGIPGLNNQGFNGLGNGQGFGGPGINGQGNGPF